MQHDYFWEKKHFHPTPGVKGKCMSKVFGSMLMYGSFRLIDMQHDYILKKFISFKGVTPVAGPFLVPGA